jgi:tetratricopeptide (TPR) repeat protein
MSTEGFGPALRHHREARGLSVRALAARVHYSKSHLSDLENGIRLPHPTLAAALDEHLEAGGALVRLFRRATAAQVARRTRFDITIDGDPTSSPLAGDGGLDEMKRRTLLGLGGVAGLGVAAPGITTETLRHGLAGALATPRATAATDEWNEIVAEYGYSYNSAPPAEVLAGLVVDILALQQASAGHREARSVRDLRRTGAYLAGLMAMTMGDLGQLRQARRWWRSARQVASDSGDVHAILWVRGREIVRSMYERRPIAHVLGLVADAERYAGDNAPPTAEVELVMGKAQALGLAGRAAEADETLDRLRDRIYPRLPSRVTDDHDSLFGWPEERLRFCESFTYSFLGNTARAQAAQDRALDLYPASFPRGRVQMELQRALCLVRDGDLTAGVQHAHTTMSGLPAAHRNRPVDDLGRRILEAVPEPDRGRADVTEFADFLALNPAAAS